MTIPTVGFRPVNSNHLALKSPAHPAAFTAASPPDVFTPSPKPQAGIRFGFAPLLEAEERIMGLAIDGGMDTHHKQALTQLFKVPGVNVTARLPKRNFLRADGQYFHEAPDASAHNLLALGWIRAAIDRKKNNDTALDEFENTLVDSVTYLGSIETLGKIVFDPVNAPAPTRYVEQVRRYATDSADHVRAAIASGLAKNPAINHFTPEVLDIVKTLADDESNSVRASLAFGLASNPQLPHFNEAVKAVFEDLATDAEPFVTRHYQQGLCSNPSIGDMNRDMKERVLTILRDPVLLPDNLLYIANNRGLPKFPHTVLRILRDVSDTDEQTVLAGGLAGNKSLPSFPPIMVRVLRNLAASPNLETRRQLASGLGGNSQIEAFPQPVVDIMGELARDKDASVLRSLHRALVKNEAINLEAVPPKLHGVFVSLKKRLDILGY